MKFVDLSGKRYGRLVVIKLDHVQKLPSLLKMLTDYRLLFSDLDSVANSNS